MLPFSKLKVVLSTFAHNVVTVNSPPVKGEVQEHSLPLPF